MTKVEQLKELRNFASQLEGITETDVELLDWAIKKCQSQSDRITKYQNKKQEEKRNARATDPTNL